ncbi:nucleotidyl transferase AbiEii/AbiGii toxin family protein [Lutibacter citreus]|uniref:nucleotidyl transferase AbiEii/AbiGii toxin family protein n=1 Tax=Lutibacter citreus TaxID=2138210 RepID=UPI000DBE554F|nr:nucleotidyl transferase AbiEii/AbiGii toxin family protein [Lutibacter citreus]
MLKNTLINRIATKKIASALVGLNQNVVYVGGAVVSLYINDPSADDVRPTKDIDISMEIANVGELEAIREEIQERGFYQSYEDNVICRFRYEDIMVDLMATKEVGWAPANPWFLPGYQHLITFDIDGVEIQCLSLPYYLATKFSAFYDRGSKDPRTSKDFEDIVYLFNYVTTLKEQVLQSDELVKSYLMTCFIDILKDGVKQEAILGHLFYEEQEIRYEKIISTLNEICYGI